MLRSALESSAKVGRSCVSRNSPVRLWRICDDHEGSFIPLRNKKSNNGACVPPNILAGSRGTISSSSIWEASASKGSGGDTVSSSLRNFRTELRVDDISEVFVVHPDRIVFKILDALQVRKQHIEGEERLGRVDVI